MRLSWWTVSLLRSNLPSHAAFASGSAGEREMLEMLASANHEARQMNPASRIMLPNLVNQATRATNLGSTTRPHKAVRTRPAASSPLPDSLISERGTR